jgi:hypothetical protein
MRWYKVIHEGKRLERPEEADPPRRAYYSRGLAVVYDAKDRLVAVYAQAWSAKAAQARVDDSWLEGA